MITINQPLVIDDKQVCAHVHFTIDKGEHIALIGRNGIGKSTLLNEIMKQSDAIMLEQQIMSDLTVMDYIMSTDEKLLSIRQQMANDYERISDYIELNGYDKENEIIMLIKKFNMEETIADRPVAALSGGEQTKISLIKMMMSEKSLLIFDEPTNHIDYSTKEWLINWMNTSSATLIYASHDRQFINDTSTKIIEMTEQSTHTYHLSYDDYAEEKARQERENTALVHRENKEKQKMKQMIQQMKEWHHEADAKAGVRNPAAQKKVAKIAKRYKIKEHQLEQKMNKFEGRKEKQLRTEFDLKVVDFKGHSLVRLEEVTMKFQDNAIFEDVTFQIKRGDKIALTGANGSGKTTLLKLIMNKIETYTGTITINPQVTIGYFSQQLDNLVDANTVLEEILKLGTVTLSEARTILAAFRFKEDRMEDRVAQLSMGEKCRLSFIKLYFSAANLLILDEPTNYFDIEMQQIVEKMLNQFEGAVLFVSHDAYFCRSVANRYLKIENKRVSEAADQELTNIEVLLTDLKQLEEISQEE